MARAGGGNLAEPDLGESPGSSAMSLSMRDTWGPVSRVPDQRGRCYLERVWNCELFAAYSSAVAPGTPSTSSTRSRYLRPLAPISLPQLQTPRASGFFPSLAQAKKYLVRSACWSNSKQFASLFSISGYCTALLSSSPRLSPSSRFLSLHLVQLSFISSSFIYSSRTDNSISTCLIGYSFNWKH